MTRLQNAKNQLSEALAELESEISRASNTSARLSKTNEKNVARVDQSALINEVSAIEAKLNEAIAIIAKIEADTIDWRTIGSRASNDIKPK